MSVLIVGGDKITSFTRLLGEVGYQQFHHWSGRKAGDHHQAIPQDTQLILLVIDQVNHGIASKIREQADALALPIIFSPRSKSRLFQQLARLPQHQRPAVAH